MKAIVLLLSTLTLLTGCGNDSAPPAETTNSASSGNPVTAPADYLGAVAKAKQTAVKTVDAASINQAVQLFHTEHGRYPKDLNELVQTKYLSQIPPAPYGMKIVYDAATGQTRIVRQ